MGNVKLETIELDKMTPVRRIEERNTFQGAENVSIIVDSRNG